MSAPFDAAACVAAIEAHGIRILAYYGRPQPGAPAILHIAHGPAGTRGGSDWPAASAIYNAARATPAHWRALVAYLEQRAINARV